MELSRKALCIKPSSTMAISSKAAQLKAEGKDIVTFGVGEPDFDTPEHIRKAGIAAIESGQTRYTAAAGIPVLRQAVCDKLKNDNGLEYEQAQIIISNGAKHSLMNVFMAILNDGDEVIIPAPYWLSYSEMVKIAGGEPVIIHTKKENQFMMTREELEQAYTRKTKAVVLTSPSNPTGMVTSYEDLKMIADFAVEKDIFVISDEIYEKLIYDENKKHISIASLGKEIYERTIVINGVSKSYAMTGWRIGYAAAPLEVAKLMGSLQSHMASNPNTIAQMATLTALNGSQDCVEEMCVEFKKRRDYIFEREEAIPLIQALKPEGAFYLFVDVSQTYGKKHDGVEINSAADFATILLDKKFVAVIPCADFGMPDYIRLSYATSMELIEKGMDRIAEMIEELV
ncbi:pyridoxal phosphate-dependent aminotransferase [Anaerotignum propionicum]|uniref:Aminotransferase n=1 Tax=Anaerotignum propionicum DSM 1682 TaxID=991789 RepID=A0A0X8VE58_ANAPI|nr:pyridoxal phosphate-dependent aminotransferase [Anaerotignum propionicum]AMJ42042.1 aspartate aminotransferase [Anaerotignum propionicum DSM 1682]SHE50163.1 aspartate aminotransferase [[Clostridium] propionicum DSM 1682] [Anaerotignum propionicum DSM 1682]